MNQQEHETDADLTTGPALVVFDFDGTLAHRAGMWTQCLLDVLDACVAGHGVTFEDLRPHLRDGFPWHRRDVAHPELNTADHWWRTLGALLDRVYLAVGVDAARLDDLRRGVGAHCCDASRFSLYPDTVASLEFVRVAGARSVTLSNHVPELESIVEHLGCDHLVDRVISSARIGFEKSSTALYRCEKRSLNTQICVPWWLTSLSMAVIAKSPRFQGWPS